MKYWIRYLKFILLTYNIEFNIKKNYIVRKRLGFQRRKYNKTYVV